MRDAMRQRTQEFQRRLKDDSIDVAIITDEDSIAWFAGYWGYLGVEFGRPTMLVVPSEGAPSVITPLMESAMAGAMTWVENVRPWQDARGPDHWDEVLADVVKPAPGLKVGIERLKMPSLIGQFVEETYGAGQLYDISR
ncbi:MAG: aminopeptidase P family N-terminal domain-containing protein, partial [Aestuariivirgaceae bacterium]